MVPQSYYRCWVEIDLDALRQNVSAIRRRLRPPTKLLAVVKADAYGHGLPQLARVLMELDVAAFGVATLTEALTLRHLGGAGWPILLFGSALPFEVATIIEHQITPTISTLDEARLFAREAEAQHRALEVQVEIDTGMGRVGFWHEDAARQIRELATLPHLKITALYTHFPSADVSRDVTRQELESFQRVVRDLADLRIPSQHAAASAALLTLPETHLDLVRAGLLLYGLCPIPDRAAEFRPLLTFKSRVAFVKAIAPGRTVSYGQTFTATSPMTIATVAVGYGDGFNRHLSNHAQVLIHEQRCPVVGRVTMDQIMVDVTALTGVRSGDEVVLIGRQGPAEITAIELAVWADTIAWEVLCAISKSARVPRVYYGASAA